MAHLKLGYHPSQVPQNCKPLLNRSSYKSTLNLCNPDVKNIAAFSFVEFLHPSDAELIPFNELGNFSDTGHVTFNNSSFQALQFGTIDAFIFTYYFITVELFQHIGFANPYLEDQYCLVMSSEAVFRIGETMDNLFWLRPFSIPIWSMLFLFLLCMYLFESKEVLKKYQISN